MHKAKPRVLLITYYFRPSIEMGALRPTRFYKYLKQMGYAVHVITATPQGSDCPADIQVIPDELEARWEKGEKKGRDSLGAYVELLIRQFMFPGHLGMLWAFKAAALCRQIQREHPNDRFALLVTYPPLGTLLVGLLAGRQETLPWIADFRDPIAGLIFPGEKRYVKFWARLLEKNVFQRASAIIANVESAAAVWRERYPWVQPKLHVIYNGFDPEESPRPRPIPPRDHKLIVHAGTIYQGRSTDAVLHSLARLRAKRVQEALSAKVLLLGVVDGDPAVNWALCHEAQQDGRLELCPPPSWDEWDRVVGEADALLLAAHPQNRMQVPGKLYAYISIGRPLLALLPRLSPVEPILQNAGVPYVRIYEDDPPEVVDDKVLEFLRLPNNASPINAWFRANFDARRQTERVAEIIDSISHSPVRKNAEIESCA